MSVIAWVGPKGTTTNTVKAADEAVRFGGHDVFFEQQLEGVGDRLQQPVGADTHGAKTHLHVGENLALKPVHRNYGDGQAAKHQQNVNEGPEEVARGTRGLVTREVGEDVVEHQRSTSPRTMSSVPITAITSATSWPRHITSRACRFTNDGGRTRKR